MTGESEDTPPVQESLEVFQKLSVDGLVYIGTTTIRIETARLIYTLLRDKVALQPRDHALEDAQVEVLIRVKILESRMVREIAIIAALESQFDH